MSRHLLKDIWHVRTDRHVIKVETPQFVFWKMKGKYFLKYLHKKLSLAVTGRIFIGVEVPVYVFVSTLVCKY